MSTKRRFSQWLLPARRGEQMTTRQYARLLDHWLAVTGLESALFVTHSLRRTNATEICRLTGNLQSCSLLS
jgi:site-specific recombinase XerD